MKRIFLTFLLQTFIVGILSIPIFFFITSDYQEFQTRQAYARSVPVGVGAVCSDSWYSRSTGSGTCSHHGGVKDWGAMLRRIAQSTWLNEASTMLVILAIGLIAWYGLGAIYIHKSLSKVTSRMVWQRKDCCLESLKDGYSTCFICESRLDSDEPEIPSSANIGTTTYLFMTTSLFLFISCVGIALAGQSETAVPEISSIVPTESPISTSSPTPSPSPEVLPEVANKAVELISNTNDQDSTTLDLKALETPTPIPEPTKSSLVTPLNIPKPIRPSAIQKILVSASDILQAGYKKDVDTRVYRFHLDQSAHVKGNFNARGNISVQIKGGYYSSNGDISSDTIDVDLAAGTYEVIVTSRQIVGFSLNLTGYFD